MHKKILIYNSGGGLGDTIQQFPLLLSLKNHFVGFKFFYLGAHENHLKNKLKEYNLDLETVDLNLKYFGFRWWHLFKVKQKLKEQNINKFDLIIDLQSKLRNTLVLKQMPHDTFFSPTFNFVFCTKKNKDFSYKKKKDLTILENLEFFINEKIKRTNFSLDMLDQKFIKESARLLPDNNYIGFSVTQGNKYRKKTCPIESFIKLAQECLNKGKKLVFFVEKSEIDLVSAINREIPEAFFPEHESKISCPALITALASRLEGAVSIDNGVMHMMNLANIPMIVLFGPTDSNKFAPKRKNVHVLDSKKLYSSKDISEITVSDVLKFL